MKTRNFEKTCGNKMYIVYMSWLNFVVFLIKLCFDSDAHEIKMVTFSKEIRIWVKKMFSPPKTSTSTFSYCASVPKKDKSSFTRN